MSEPVAPSASSASTSSAIDAAPSSCPSSTSQGSSRVNDSPPRSLAGRLLTLGVLVFLITGVGQFLAVRHFQQQYDLAQQRRGLADEILIQSLQARRAEKDFQLRSLEQESFYRQGRSQFLEKHDTAMGRARDAIDQLEALGGDSWRKQVGKLRTYAINYNEVFQRFVQQYREMGTGRRLYEHQLGQLLHDTSHFLAEQSAWELVMLVGDLAGIQNHFFALADPLELAAWQEKATELEAALPSLEISKAREVFSRYQQLFARYRDHWEEIGLTENQGMQGEFRRAIHAVEPLVDQLQEEAAQQAEAAHQRLLAVSMAVQFVSLILGSAALLLFGRRITRSLQALRAAAESLGAGRMDQRVVVPKVHDEVRVLALAFNAMGEELRRTTVSRNYVDRILDSMAEALLVTGRDGVIRTVNPAACQLLGWTETELRQRLLSELLDPAEEKRMRREMSDARGKTQLDLSLITKERHAIPVLLTAARMTGDDEGIVCLARDIRERKEAEERIRRINAELAESNASKDRFFSIISHDLRGPFNVILGFSELMAMDAERMSPGEVQELAAEMLKASRQQFRLLEELLTWSRLTLGKMVPRPLLLDPEEEAMQVISLFEASAVAKGIQLDVEAQQSVPLWMDRDMFLAILRNLVSNAVKFTHHGGRVVVEISQQDQQGLIAVRDNGVGMTPEVTAALFRLDKVHTTPGTAREKGSGLGLILCREMAEKSGGTLSVESTPGQGSVFLVRLPLASSHPTP
ncbi:MAG: PAS domain S-box protein [Magnetococcales bacterium]|nr:PAS domain S-box protein [Magnetococcales bacterium]